MKRLLIFLLLGPLLGAWVAMIVPNPAAMSLTALWLGTLIMLPYFYLVGAAPAMLVAMLDASLERRGVRWRILACAVAGYAGSYVAYLFGSAWMRGPSAILWGISGLVAGAVCSWLSGKPRRA